MLVLIHVYNFFQKKNKFKTLLSFYRPLTKNKSLELEILYSNYFLFKLELDMSFTGKDHAGIRFEICLLGLEFTLNFYDNRHWDCDADAWEL
jgi:hypothetical protein